MKNKDVQEELFQTCLNNDESAIELAYMLADISHLFDDIIDGDNKITKQDVYRVMESALVKIHYNKFFQAFMAELVPMFSSAITTWIAANDIEEKARDSGQASLMHVSLITKSAFTPVFLHMCKLVGGTDHARECAPFVYSFVFDENIESYCDEHGVDPYGLYEQTEEGASESVGARTGTDG